MEMEDLNLDALQKAADAFEDAFVTPITHDFVPVTLEVASFLIDVLNSITLHVGAPNFEHTSSMIIRAKTELEGS